MNYFESGEELTPTDLSTTASEATLGDDVVTDANPITVFDEAETTPAASQDNVTIVERPASERRRGGTARAAAMGLVGLTLGVIGTDAGADS